ncbi:aspartate/glutamate racemase family protein [Vagococcus hydrophili]|uniref:Amino acid racemase n=1 Tax=Vagococcus hydrophili TaxID=2714947 RepID=A0A6G8AUY9_9ENTE|nr:amino acid racemase [Vagococcus hydrophili]QIL48800.1 amino acid racemase [Vagococcus hydrophili]
MDNFFTIIGGMGTIATELYIKQINQKTPATNDQEYLNYVLVNYSTIPDRSSYLMNKGKNENPLPYLLNVIKQQSALKPNFFVLTCNTAHYFYDELQKASDVPFLHMPRLAVEEVSKNYPLGTRVGLIGTEGTIKNKIYDPFILEAGFDLVHPTLEIQQMVSTLIFDKIKQKNELDTELYNQILEKMFALNCDVLILGCTELSLMEDAANYQNKHVIDPQNVLAEESVKLALSFRK